MNIQYKNSANKNGIYFIRNIINGRLYVGSTVRFKKRSHDHIASLKTNRHSNKYLQNDFNKCGEEAFIFEVIEVVEEKSQLLIREQYYIDQFYDSQDQCYNFRKLACDSRAGKKNKNPIAENSKVRQKHSPETIEKRRESVKEAYQDPELRQISSDNAMKRWKDHSANIILINKDTKEEVLVKTSLRQFALDKNLSYKSLHQLVKGKTKSCGGWYLKENGEPIYKSQKGDKRKPLSDEHRNKIAKGKYKGFKLIHLMTGEILEIGGNTKDFARKHNMYYTTLMKVICGQTKTINGYGPLSINNTSLI